MNNKTLYAVIAVLVVVLAVETGYLLGKGRGFGKSEVSPAKVSREKSVSSDGGLISRRPRPSGLTFAGTGRDWSDWDPFAEMINMQRVMNRMFNDSFGRASRLDSSLGMKNISFDPAMDVRDMGDAYLVTIDIPGVDKDAVNINVASNSLTVSGERTVEREDRDEENGFYSSERSYGSFSRTIPLPEKIVTRQVTAEATDGVLVVKLPKESAGEDISGEGIEVTVE
jgi:HSP20 family protein